MEKVLIERLAEELGIKFEPIKDKVKCMEELRREIEYLDKKKPSYLSSNKKTTLDYILDVANFALKYKKFDIAKKYFGMAIKNINEDCEFLRNLHKDSKANNLKYDRNQIKLIFTNKVENKWRQKDHCILNYIFCDLKLNNIKGAEKLYKAYSRQIDSTKNVNKNFYDILNLISGIIECKNKGIFVQNLLKEKNNKQTKSDISIVCIN